MLQTSHRSAKRLLNIRTPKHLALRLDRPLELLKTLAHYRGAQYRTRSVPKSDGVKDRRISPPSVALKNVQRRIDDLLLKSLCLPDIVHGYRRRRSIVTAATPHQGERFLLVMDIRDFFPSIGHRQVYEMYRRLGCSPNVAKLLTELTTNDHCLPQGAPTSSSLANLYIRMSGMANRLSRLAAQHDLRITIFGDDILLSGERPFRGLESHVASIIQSCGLAVNQEKSRARRPGEKQQVLGIVVNSNGSDLNVPYSYRRRLRSLIRLYRRRGPSSLATGGRDPIAYLKGKTAFAVFVNPSNRVLYAELEEASRAQASSGPSQRTTMAQCEPM
jgi:RNA-directed DNA polymerase